MTFSAAVDGLHQRHKPAQCCVAQARAPADAGQAGASIGANATVVCGATLGRYCFIGAGAVVTKDVSDYALMTGVPARCTGWMCKCGVKLRDEMMQLTCPDCGRQYTGRGEKMAPTEAGEP